MEAKSRAERHSRTASILSHLVAGLAPSHATRNVERVGNAGVARDELTCPEVSQAKLTMEYMEKLDGLNPSFKEPNVSRRSIASFVSRIRPAIFDTSCPSSSSPVNNPVTSKRHSQLLYNEILTRSARVDGAENDYSVGSSGPANSAMEPKDNSERPATEFHGQELGIVQPFLLYSSRSSSHQLLAEVKDSEHSADTMDIHGQNSDNVQSVSSTSMLPKGPGHNLQQTNTIDVTEYANKSDSNWKGKGKAVAPPSPPEMVTHDNEPQNIYIGKHSEKLESEGKAKASVPQSRSVKVTQNDEFWSTAFGNQQLAGLSEGEPSVPESRSNSKSELVFSLHSTKTNSNHEFEFPMPPTSYSTMPPKTRANRFGFTMLPMSPSTMQPKTRASPASQGVESATKSEVQEALEARGRKTSERKRKDIEQSGLMKGHGELSSTPINVKAEITRFTNDLKAEINAKKQELQDQDLFKAADAPNENAGPTTRAETPSANASNSDDHRLADTSGHLQERSRLQESRRLEIVRLLKQMEDRLRRDMNETIRVEINRLGRALHQTLDFHEETIQGMLANVHTLVHGVGELLGIQSEE